MKTPMKPEPMELAKLAAQLAPNDPPSAMDQAMRFYVEAVLFCRELPSNSDELIKRFGSDQRRVAAIFKDASSEPMSEIMNDTLEFCPSKKDGDEARDFLGIKKPESFMNIIQEYLEQPRDFGTQVPGAMDPTQEGQWNMYVVQFPNAHDFIAQWKNEKSGTYYIPKHFLKMLVTFRKERTRASRKRGATTKADRTRQKSPAPSR